MIILPRFTVCGGASAGVPPAALAAFMLLGGLGVKVPIVHQPAQVHLQRVAVWRVLVRGGSRVDLVLREVRQEGGGGVLQVNGRLATAVAAGRGTNATGRRCAPSRGLAAAISAGRHLVVGNSLGLTGDGIVQILGRGGRVASGRGARATLAGDGFALLLLTDLALAFVRYPGARRGRGRIAGRHCRGGRLESLLGAARIGAAAGEAWGTGSAVREWGGCSAPGGGPGRLLRLLLQLPGCGPSCGQRASRSDRRPWAATVPGLKLLVRLPSGWCLGGIHWPAGL